MPYANKALGPVYVKVGDIKMNSAVRFTAEHPPSITSPIKEGRLRAIEASASNTTGRVKFQVLCHRAPGSMGMVQSIYFSFFFDDCGSAKHPRYNRQAIRKLAMKNKPETDGASSKTNPGAKTTNKATEATTASPNRFG